MFYPGNAASSRQRPCEPGSARAEDRRSRGLPGLCKEGARILQRFLIVFGKVRAAQLRQALFNVLLQTQELAPEFILLGSALTWFESRNFRRRGLRAFRRRAFVGLEGVSVRAACLCRWGGRLRRWGGGVSSGSGGGGGSSITITCGGVEGCTAAGGCAGTQRDPGAWDSRQSRATKRKAMKETRAAASLQFYHYPTIKTPIHLHRK